MDLHGIRPDAELVIRLSAELQNETFAWNSALETAGTMQTKPS